VFLQAVGAVLATAVAVGAYTFDGYLFYDNQTSNETRIVAVAPGQAGTVHNIEWKASVVPTQGPANSKLGKSVAWLKVDITRKILDADSATMIGTPNDLRLQDRAGRTWVVEVVDEDRPTDDKLEMGREYAIHALAVVPAPVAAEVELSMRPTSYRSDTPTKDFFDRKAASKLKPDTDVLRFKR
jgi:hypothetical protein